MFLAAINRRRYGTRPAPNPDAVSLRAKLTLWSDLSATSGTAETEYIEGNTGFYTNPGSMDYTSAGCPAGTIGKKFRDRGAFLTFLQTAANQNATPGWFGLWFKKPTTATNLLADLFARMRYTNGVGAEPALEIVMAISTSPVPNRLALTTKGTSGSITGTFRPGATAEWYDNVWHHFVYSTTHTGTTIPYATKDSNIYVDGALKLNDTTDDGPLFHANPANGLFSSTFGDFVMGGQAGISGSADHSMGQLVAGTGAITAAEAAYLALGKNWAQFQSDLGF